MLRAAFRDLAWRRRRYLISTVGCGLVFAMSLLMTGLGDAFPVELDRTIAHVGGERGFLVPDGVSGPFTGFTPFDASSLPDGTQPLLQSPQTVNPAEPVSAVLLGVPPGGPSEPRVVSGRQLRGPQEVLVADSAPFATGSTVTAGGNDYRVVGRVERLTLTGGIPGVVMDIEDLRQVLFQGRPLATAAVVTAAGVTRPDGLSFVSAEQAREDGLRVLESAKQSIDFVKVLLWAVAALIIGSVVFLSAVERTRDFAVFKAIGTSTSSMAAGLLLQAVLLSVAASLVGIVLALLLAPAFPMPVDISWRAMVLLPLLAVGVGALASLFGLRRAVRVEPALAFGGAV
jgi:putative ABC transport system permease protein